MTLKITSLVENTRTGEHLACEHGLSLLMEWRDKIFLMDTGASDIFKENAEILRKDLTKVDYVILSHGHSDHSGGVRTLCDTTRRKFQLVANLQYFNKKFKREKEFLRYIGNDFNEEFLQIENVSTIFPLTDTFKLVDDVYILSGIPSAVDFEEEANDFVVLRAGQYGPDRFEDEQVMVFDLPKGLVLIAGCAHRGIVNICEAVKQRFHKPIQAIIGGLHLKDSEDTRIEKTANYFREENIPFLAIGHCTGERGLHYLEGAGLKPGPLSSGTVMEFED